MSQSSRVRARSSSVVAGVVVVVTIAAFVGGCNEGQREAAVDVTVACNQLEALAGVVLSLGSATTVEEVRTAMDEPIMAFVEAAEKSRDEALAELARTYESRFSAYVEGEGIEATQAGKDADIALDLAGARCAELGATNIFPSEP